MTTTDVTEPSYWTHGQPGHQEWRENDSSSTDPSPVLWCKEQGGNGLVLHHHHQVEEEEEEEEIPLYTSFPHHDQIMTECCLPDDLTSEDQDEHLIPLFPPGHDEHLAPFLTIQSLVFPTSLEETYLAQQFHQPHPRSMWCLTDPFDVGSLLPTGNDDDNYNVYEQENDMEEDEVVLFLSHMAKSCANASALDQENQDQEDVLNNKENLAHNQDTHFKCAQQESSLFIHPETPSSHHDQQHVGSDKEPEFPQIWSQTLLPPPPPLPFGHISFDKTNIKELEAFFDSAIFKANVLRFGPPVGIPMDPSITPPLSPLPSTFKKSDPNGLLDSIAVMPPMPFDGDEISVSELNSIQAQPFPQQQRYFRCPRPFCSKIYRNSSGLKYHMERGTCSLSPTPDFESLDVPMMTQPSSSSTTTTALVPPPKPDVVVYLERPTKIRVPPPPYLCRACPSDQAKMYKSRGGIAGHYERQHAERDVFESLVPGGSSTNGMPPAPPTPHTPSLRL